MGIGTVIKSKRVIVLAFSEGVAGAVLKTVESAPSDYAPSFLQASSRNVNLLLRLLRGIKIQ